MWCAQTCRKQTGALSQELGLCRRIMREVFTWWRTFGGSIDVESVTLSGLILRSAHVDRYHDQSVVQHSETLTLLLCNETPVFKPSQSSYQCLMIVKTTGALLHVLRISEEDVPPNSIQAITVHSRPSSIDCTDGVLRRDPLVLLTPAPTCTGDTVPLAFPLALCKQSHTRVNNENSTQ